MKQIRFLFLVLCLTTVSAYAARQAAGQRLYSRLNLNKQQPRLLLPAAITVEMSALSIERDPSSGVTHLTGEVEMKMAPGTGLLTILRADEVTYNPNTGDIESRGNVTICTSGTVGPTGPCL
jgi:lipopolysaccharide assembly outer membrane protein LptD (OstA)